MEFIMKREQEVDCIFCNGKGTVSELVEGEDSFDYEEFLCNCCDGSGRISEDNTKKIIFKDYTDDQFIPF